MTTTESRDSLAKLTIDRSTPAAPSLFWRFTKSLLILLLLIGFAGAGTVAAMHYGLLPDEPGWNVIPDAVRPAVEVRVARVQTELGRTGDATVVATGYLESRRQAKIGARAPGRIEAIHVEEGTRVNDKQILAVLEHADLDASLAAARASLERSEAEAAEHEVEILRAKRDLDRAESLRESSGISNSDYDDAKFTHEAALARRSSLKAAVSLAQARVLEAEQLRENMFIRASFDGTVISKDAEVGESILPGGMGEASGRGSVVTIADLDHLEAECDVKEDYIGRVSIGQSAEVAVDAVPERRYRGRVRKIIPMGDRARATIKVQVEILNVDNRLFPEMSTTVYFLPSDTTATESETDQPRIFCPTDAIVTVDGEQFVFLIGKQNRVRRVPIKAIAVRDDRTEVSGLSGNERIVIKPPQDLDSGDLVKATE